MPDHSTSSRIRVAVAIAAPLGLVAAEWSALKEPHWWDGMSGVAATALDLVDTGTLGDVANFGHPPLLPVLVALAWKTFGVHVAVSHAITLAFGALALVLTQALATRWFGVRAGIVAIALLGFHALFFAQVGLVGDGAPLAALTLLAVYALERAGPRSAAWLAAGTLLVLAKETTAVVFACLALHVFVEAMRAPGTEPWQTRARSGLLSAVFVALPLVLLAAWLVYVRTRMGWSLRTDLVSGSSGLGARLLESFGRHFGYDWTDAQTNRTHFLLMIPIAVRAVRRRGLGAPTRLVVTIAAAYVALFAYTVDLPRYHVAYLPLLCVAAAGALEDLPPAIGRFAAPAVVLAHVAVSLASFTGRRNVAGYKLESNLEYRDALATHLEAARFVEAHRPGATVIAAWPLTTIFREARHGYVSRGFPLAKASEAPEKAVVVASDQSADAALARRFDRSRLRAVGVFEHGGRRTIVYDYDGAKPP